VQVNIERDSRRPREEGRDTRIEIERDSRRPREEGRDTRIEIERDSRRPREEGRQTRIDVEYDRKHPSHRAHFDRFEERVDHERPLEETELDITERKYRTRVQPSYEANTQPTYDVEYKRADHDHHHTEGRRVDIKATTFDVEERSAHGDRDHPHRTAEVTVEERNFGEQEFDRDSQKGMGYYDNDGNYHSFRRGLESAAERLVHPFKSHDREHHHNREEVIIEEREHDRPRQQHRHHESGEGRETVSFREHEREREHEHEHEPHMAGTRYIERGGHPARNTVTIPCHHIRVGDLLVLQGRPCQVIRITTSAQTGQHRYLGVDLFTKQLHEESSFVSNPQPSVVVQTMLGPVFKEYRVLDIRTDGRVVAMTETGDVKQGLPIIDQGSLFERLDNAFADGRGSVRVLVVNDGGRELAVDFKVIHGSRL